MALLCDMPYRTSERSVSDERALLEVLGASRRIASFKAMIARQKRRLPHTAVMAQPEPEDDLACDLPMPAPAAVPEAY